MGGKAVWEGRQCGREGSVGGWVVVIRPARSRQHITSLVGPSVDVLLPSRYTSPSIRIIEAKWHNSLTTSWRLCPSVSSVSPHRRHSRRLGPRLSGDIQETGCCNHVDGR